MKIPVELEVAWYILRYSEKFDGTLSDADCFRKIVYEKNGANLWQFKQIKNELMQMSEKEMADLKECLVFYGML